MRPDVDLLILGGGCAGLSLAAELASQDSPSIRTLILESRSEYSNDRTWCFWGDDAAPYARIASQQWSCFSIRHGAQQIKKFCPETPYHMLESGHFYDATLAKIKQASHIELKLGAPVTSNPVHTVGRWTVDTVDGPVSAKFLIDTRPQALPELGGAVLWQSFYGYEVECVDAVFDATCVDLMDFEIETEQGVAFTYVLPISATRALIEYTVFSVMSFSRDQLQNPLLSAITQRVRGKNFQIIRTESGILPMGLGKEVQQQGSSSAIRVGLSVGAGRPATGYAFQRIQRWSQACAHAILSGGLPVTHSPDPFLLRHMDRIFLEVLRRYPKLGPSLLTSLFSKVNSERVIRFLSDQGRLSDYLSIVLALPPKPFLAQLFTRPSSS